jgi:hypothetical protein
LAKEEKAHPANYRGCRYKEEERQKRKSQRTPKTTTRKEVLLRYKEEERQKRKSQRTPKTTMRRGFSSNLATPDVSFAAAL